MHIQLCGLDLDGIIQAGLNFEKLYIGAVNLTFILAVLILIGGFIKGYKQGFAAEVISLVSLLVAVAALIVLIRSVKEYLSKDMLSVAVGVISLIVIVLVYKIAGFILEAFKLLHKIPVIKIGDALAGGLVGMAEGIVVIWLLFTLLAMFRFGGINAYVMEDVTKNHVLKFLLEHNYIAVFVSGIL